MPANERLAGMARSYKFRHLVPNNFNRQSGTSDFSPFRRKRCMRDPCPACCA